MSPKILFIDIETSPNLVYRFDDLSMPATTPLEFLVEPSRILCFAAKFYNEKTLFRGENIMSHEDMILSAWEMFNEADVVVTFNGNRFDLPWLNTEFHQAGLPKPSPYKSLDLYQVMKQFKLPSKKLAYISKRFGWGSGKISSGGISTWLKVMEGDKKAWATFKKYNMIDTEVLEEGFDTLLSWFPGWFNQNLYQGTEDLCPKCGSSDTKPQGRAYLASGVYQRFMCGACGSWSRSGKRLAGVDLR